jgi:glycerol uptake facilitator protein
MLHGKKPCGARSIGSIDPADSKEILVQGFLGELIGTMTLILLGNGVVAGVSLKGSYAENGGWNVIATAWGLAVICAVIVALAAGSDAHLNPAVTIGVSIATGDWSQAPTYVAAQFVGAFLGAVLVWLHYYPLWGQTDNAGAKRACFCTTPAVRHTPSNALSEIIGTFVLVFVAAAIFSDNLSPNGLAPGVGPLLVGLLVWGIGLSLGGVTGYAINPARDLGPRLAHAFLPIPGKGSSGWDYAAIPIIGPVIGAVLAGLAVLGLGI